MSDRTFESPRLLTNALGVLAKELNVRVLNCSRTGCLVETNSRLEVGSIASLRATLLGDEFVDDVQIVRCQEIEGGGHVYHVGAEFLWTDTPGKRSLRQLVGRIAPSVGDKGDG
jgi:hypothetical protein